MDFLIAAVDRMWPPEDGQRLYRNRTFGACNSIYFAISHLFIQMAYFWWRLLHDKKPPSRCPPQFQAGSLV